MILGAEALRKLGYLMKVVVELLLRRACILPELWDLQNL